MFRAMLLGLTLFATGGGCGRPALDTDESLSSLFPKAPVSQAAPVAIAADRKDWAAAIAPREFAFPADHCAHEDYRIEWWYYTGNLQTKDGRRFGYQLTFFRTGLHRQPANPSQWAVRDLYTTHFAVSDFRNRRHYCLQRNNRRGIGQAGAETDHYHVWNGDWRARLSGDNHQLTANDAEAAINLTLQPTKPPALHGEHGLSRKGPAIGNASYYYSLTRMATVGTIRVGDDTFAVQGDSWMDHEFSTSFLEPGQLGWDWFALQLNNGVDLMLYRMRKRDGTTDAFSSGSLIDKSGALTHLTSSDFQLTPRGKWRSAETGAVYPLRWKIELPSMGYQLDIQPAFDEQEMTTTVTTGISYWEGAVAIAGRMPGQPLRGKGYVELTGYVGEGLGALVK